MRTINGSNKLIVEGELCVRNTSDILSFYPEVKKGRNNLTLKEQINVPDSMKDIYKILDKKGKTIDEICCELKCNVSDILFKLTMLEMSGLAMQYQGKIFKKI